MATGRVSKPCQRFPTKLVGDDATVLLLALGGVTFVAHLLVAGSYGYFRDELYYLADGRHLQAGYVDQPLLMGWLAAFLRVTIGNGLVAIHLVPALACALIVVVTGRLARELGGGWVAQAVAGVAALFCADYLGTGSLFSMDGLDQLWWALLGLLVAGLLRGAARRQWLLVGLVGALALLTKLTVLFFGVALVLALLVTPERRLLRSRWPWLAAGLAFLGLLPLLVWNAANGWPTWEFYRTYRGVGVSPQAFFIGQLDQLSLILAPLAAVGLVFYFRKDGAPFRVLGWTFVFAYLILTVLGTKTYFLAAAYPIPLAAGSLAFERFRPRRWLAWTRPAYVGLVVLVGILLAPDTMPILPPAAAVQIYGSLPMVLADRFGWDTLTQTVEQVYTALPPDQQAQACVLTSNYGEAAALQQLARPGRLPPVISGHNNYYGWGSGACTGAVLILVGYSPSDVAGVRNLYGQITLAATERCQYCLALENNLAIYVLASPAGPIFPQQWPMVKHYD